MQTSLHRFGPSPRATSPYIAYDIFLRSETFRSIATGVQVVSKPLRMNCPRRLGRKLGSSREWRRLGVATDLVLGGVRR